ncbi:TetR/AcrR family transcriptional regulator [Oscillatoria sp. CS-180]|uniref:TetR/AcrR family transcriptional regulator n=1 Tax=Oscillatoria sp. CS-180 TaxID=3021720 RepID=UPI00232EACC7|nr:TetR/AcrR family transcriptional regulator [Oscillatoria sp. CS-180]MDB9527227.1 TetR/AcrR family transcriptional regulator [Oscillatoria sp. CS-180]
MARSKTFDRKLVLDKAMQVFWEKGYEAASMQMLVDAMGINRGSLYDTFQDKRTLFLQAIAHYNATVVQPAIAPLLAPGASRPEIEQHFLTLVERITTDQNRRGCLATNTVTALAAKDPDITISLQNSLRQVEDAFYRALVRAQDKGEISTDKDIRAVAHYLTSNIQGLRVMSKVNSDSAVLQQTVGLILQILD